MFDYPPWNGARKPPVYGGLQAYKNSYTPACRSPATVTWHPFPRSHVTTSAQASRPPYLPSTLNLVTAFFMVVFRVLAVAAFFYFSWTNLIVAVVLHWFAVGFGISLGYHRLHTHRGYKTSKAFEYLPGRLRNVDTRRRTDFLGCDPSRASPALGPRGRSAHAARRRLVGAHGVDGDRRYASQQDRIDGALRARSVLQIPSIAG